MASYNDDPRRYPTSARKYVPGMYSTSSQTVTSTRQYPPSRSQVDEFLEDIDTVETTFLQPVNVIAPIARRTSSQKSVAKGSAMPIEYAYAPPQPKPMRRTTAEDQAINMKLAKGFQRQASRRRFLRVAGGLVGAACVGGLFVEWGNASLKSLNETMQEGATAASSATLVCGHQDSQANPTELHAYLSIKADAIFLLEIPGGNASHAHLFQSKPLSTHFKKGELDHAYLQIIPEEIEAGKYQIRLILTGSAAGFLASVPAPAEWLLVDRNGQFVAVQPTAK